MLSIMVAVYRWHLVECKVATIGTKFVSQELTRQGPVVDHCVPDCVDDDWEDKHQMALGTMVFCIFICEA